LHELKLGPSLAGDLVKLFANALAAQPPSIILPKPKLLRALHAVLCGSKNRGVTWAVGAGHFFAFSTISTVASASRLACSFDALASEDQNEVLRPT
jgi:hypothetical protein